ncbi:MAG: sortase [Clostridia bacterium]|nr:sortase [Clostridia bacterium]
MSVFRDRDFFPDEPHRVDIDELFAELCLDSVGAKPTAIPEPSPKPEEPPTDHPKAETPDVTLPEAPEPAKVPEKPAEPTKAATASPKKAKKKKHRIRRFFLGLIPRKGDSVLEVIRKCVCVIALLVFLGSACVLLNDFVIEPIRGRMVSDAARQGRVNPLTSDQANFDGYPAGILENLKKNYYKNHDLIGWISYPSASEYWYGVDYPVVQRPGDNDYYLKRDFDQNENKNGSIYMDYRCDYATPDSDCPVTLIYGHNMRSGLMFASLNQLLDLSMARSSPTFTFSSLFEENTYKVFAVFNVDTAEAGAYDFLNQPTMSDDDFARYIAEMRVRSWFDYDSVDVNVNDKIVLLYTCSNTYQTTMGSSGRTLVAARRVRPGESPEMDVSTITTNADCVMPKVWYANKGLPLPDYYQNGVPAEYIDAVGRSALPTAAPNATTTTKKTTTTTKKKTTATTVPAHEPEEPDYEDATVTTAAPTPPPTEPTEPPAPVEPISAEPEPPVSAESEPPVSAEPEPPISIEPEESAIEEPVDASGE